MSEANDTLIRNFCDEWDTAKPDVQRLLTYFTDDAVYHNMPVAPVEGKEAIGQTLTGLFGNMQSKGFEVRWQIATDELVVNERVDHFDADGKEIAIPVCGVFEIRDGKISAWRDYFDLGTWMQQAG
jgi:limonene-1,2-epoxide hydrolase